CSSRELEPGHRAPVDLAETGDHGVRSGGTDRRHGPRGERHHRAGWASSTRDALWPPNPNELESTVAPAVGRGRSRTRSTAGSTSGSHRFATGGTRPTRAESRPITASTAPA